MIYPHAILRRPYASHLLSVRSYRQPEPTARRANGAHLADLANRAPVLRVILRAVEWARRACLACIDGRIGGAADVELAEGVELDVDGIVGRSLADDLDLSGLAALLECENGRH